MKMIKHCLPILYADKTLYDILKQGCKFSRKKAPTLGTMLSPSLFHSHSPPSSSLWPETVGSYPCGFATCKQFKIHKKSRSVTSFSQKTYSLKNYINYNSKMVVYIKECSICQMQYVGCIIHNLQECLNISMIHSMLMQKTFPACLNTLEWCIEETLTRSLVLV